MLTVGPGDVVLPGESPVGVGGTAALVVKLTIAPLVVPTLFVAWSSK